MKQQDGGNQIPEVVNYHCNICDSDFQSLNVLKEHIMSFHEFPPSVELHCNLCDDTFWNMALLNVHIRTFHGEAPAHSKPSQQSGPQNDTQPARCAPCELISASNYQVEKHNHFNYDHCSTDPCDKCDTTLQSVEKLAVHK